jgi:IS30 family transposase
MIGRHHKGAVLTLLERKSLYCWLMPMVNRKAGITATTCVQALAAFKPHSITLDNGKEFTQHPTVAAVTGADIYIADTYQSNQRARNENNNGLVRQFLPSDMPLDQLDPIYVRRIEQALNTRPRKSLGWKTPEQVLYEY